MESTTMSGKMHLTKEEFITGLRARSLRNKLFNKSKKIPEIGITAASLATWGLEGR